DVLVELVLDGPRRGDMGEQGLGNAATAFLLVDDRLAELDTLATDIDIPWSLDQGSHVAIALATEGAISIAVATGVSGRPSSCPTHAGLFIRHAVSLTRPSRTSRAGI